MQEWTADVGLPFSDKKLFRGIRNKTEQTAVPSEFRLFRGITKTVPSLFRGFFSELNFDGNPRQMSPFGEVGEDNLKCNVDEALSDVFFL
jgi:hypothetical protein